MHHAYARGNDRQDISSTVRIRDVYLTLLGQVGKRCGWRCLAYCLMRNHVHLLARDAVEVLGVGIHRLHGLYAQSFNKRHRRSGHLFQERFGSVPMESDAQVLEVARYIARNPVAAGLCGDAADWPWSSHAAAFASAGPAWLDTARLLEYFGQDGGDPLRRYADFVSKGDSPPYRV